jgi:hypothetical protein
MHFLSHVSYDLFTFRNYACLISLVTVDVLIMLFAMLLWLQGVKRLKNTQILFSYLIP